MAFDLQTSRLVTYSTSFQDPTARRTSTNACRIPARTVDSAETEPMATYAPANQVTWDLTANWMSLSARQVSAIRDDEWPENGECVELSQAEIYLANTEGIKWNLVY